MVRKIKWKPLKLPLSQKIVNQKYCILEEITEISATIKDLHDVWVVVPSPFYSTILPVKKTNGLWRMIIDY